MKLLGLIMILAFLLYCSNNSSKEVSMNSRYSPGQIWEYKTRPQEKNSRLIIYKVEKNEKLGNIIHVYVYGLKIKKDESPFDYNEEISHMPFSEKAIDKSVIKQIGTTSIPKKSDEGYRTWKSAFDKGKAGIFTIEVSEGIQYIEEVLNKQ